MTAQHSIAAVQRPGVQSVAEIATPQAEQYLAQLCKHFQHKLPATYDEHAGHIPFPIGDCRLRAGDGTLTLALESADHAQLAKLEEVVASHLLRFAFREKLSVDWKEKDSRPN
jgi:uncharacterized protein